MKTLISFSSAPTRLIMTGLVTGLLLLSGCGGSSGSKVEPNGPPDDDIGSEVFVYKGDKPAANGDINKFEKELWVKIAPPDKCGGCHNTGAPAFARGDDINLAYQAAIGLVDMINPEQSRLVTKIGGGHHCFENLASDCVVIMTTWIRNWVDKAETEETVVVLSKPADRTVDDTLSFPPTTAGLDTSFLATLQQYCSNCHSDTAITKQQPYFASQDIEIAYQAVKSKIRLDNPSASRLVVRLNAESHNCWSDCTTNATVLANQITAFVDSLPEPEPLDANLPVSKAVGLSDAFVLRSVGRVDSEALVRYEFKAGKGSTAIDSNGTGVNLNLMGNVDWSSAWGVKIDTGGRLQAETEESDKITNGILGTGEYSIETWVIPDNTDQGDNLNNPARIVTLSFNNTERNFALGQYEYSYSFLNRTDKSDANGLNEVSTTDDVLQASLQHVVATFDPVNGRRIFVNGELNAIDDEDKGAVLRDWEQGFALAVGNEVTGAVGTQWKGSVRFLAIHKRALSSEDILKNYAQGVGARYLLLFNISEQIAVEGSYIVFEVLQLDDYGYLFSAPFYTNLDGNTPSAPIPVRGLRIGVNGAEVPTGQVFANLNTFIDGDEIGEDGRQELSRLGTIVEVKTSPVDDVFFLSFDQIGALIYDGRDIPEPVEPSPLAITPEQPLLGLRNFAEINATLSHLTTVPTTNEAIANLYQKVEQQLPTLTNMDGFLSAHQMGITQLAVSYCNELVNSTSLRTDYFPGFPFGAAPSAAFTDEGRSQIIEPLLRSLLASDVADGENASPLLNQADPDELRTHLNDLISNMPASCTEDCTSAERTKTTVIAACAASMSSAVMLLQ